METQKAFIAAQRYMNKDVLPFGVGVIASFDEETAMNDTARIKNLECANEWWEIEIPPEDSFLNLDQLLEHNSKTVLNSLCSQEALSMLFYDEKKDFDRHLDEVLKETGDYTQYGSIAREKINEFFEEKIQIIKKHITVDSLINFITNKAKTKQMAVTCSFLFMQGINGIIYEQQNTRRILIFDAKKSIQTKQLKTALLNDTRFSA